MILCEGASNGKPVYTMVKIKAAVFLFYKALLNLLWNILYWSEFSAPATAQRSDLYKLPVAVVNPAAVFLRHKIRKLSKRNEAQHHSRPKENNENY